MSDYLTPKQAAEVLGCSHDVILRAIDRGDLPAVRYGRLVRIARVDFDAFLTAHRTAARTTRRRLRSTA